MPDDVVTRGTDTPRSGTWTAASDRAQLGSRWARSRLGYFAAVLLAGLLVAAAAPSPTFAKPVLGSVKQTCMTLSAVLSDGPDPDADPVGYAQAQILPLREIHTKDAKLQRAIDQLATAYQEFVRDDGKGKTAHSDVSVAAKKVDAICPGATS